MPSSPARVAANKRNSSLSTGPRDTSRSRLNALKHGLTGAGVALPSEDHVEIDRRFKALGEEFQPSTESGRIHLHRYAFLSVRLERCERHDTAILSNRVRHAESEFDDLRMAEIERHAANLIREPMTSSRRLQTTPEGIDRSWLEYWLELRGDLMIEDREASSGDLEPLGQVRDADVATPEGNIRIDSASRALTEAVGGFFANLDPSDGAGLDDQARSRWARDEIAGMIDAEVARLKEVRETLDFEAIERDRAESVDRVLFDASKEMVLARKYEAATERAMYRALKEFHAAEAAAGESIEAVMEPSESDVKSFGETICDPMASFEQNPEPEPSEPEGFRVPPRRTMPPSPPAPPISVLEVSNDGEKALEHARNGPG